MRRMFSRWILANGSLCRGPNSLSVLANRKETTANLSTTPLLIADIKQFFSLNCDSGLSWTTKVSTDAVVHCYFVVFQCLFCKLSFSARMRYLYFYWSKYSLNFSRYFRSGKEMVRMATVYYDEGKLEEAYKIYLRFSMWVHNYFSQLFHNRGTLFSGHRYFFFV